ncbi:MAG TPA: RdgB/HAM1 family non-canonical purine NTP pyrophosphatase [Ferruginibacter sp.]|nr:RdgB/HAM1 family non-canonical purine NTP pyrophosphatase [Ferruginibacter sp.]HPH89676.1 RdgB/HAM1 family non-canonical purine NTP pyrophosphatase [Ferruginibacter sp.]
MTNQIVFATNNANKVAEIKNVLGGQFEVISLKDAGIEIDIPEPYDTLEENARTKSTTIFELTSKDCFSEDTGLFVDALNGAPGVKSARYAGEQATNQDNIQKLLLQLNGIENRTARFRTVISLMQNGTEQQFEGICEGIILPAPIGEKGFGYDALFIPNGSSKSFAQMETEEKNLYSHRKKAVKKLIDFLNR